MNTKPKKLALPWEVKTWPALLRLERWLEDNRRRRAKITPDETRELKALIAQADTLLNSVLCNLRACHLGAHLRSGFDAEELA